MANPTSASETYSLESVHPSDSPGLANTMMSAMYRDPHWAALWSLPLPQIISDCASRLPWNLVNGGALKRYQKVIHVPSGDIVGYARWILPAGMEEKWEEARVRIDGIGGVERGLMRERFEGTLENGQIRGLNSQMANDLSLALEEAEAELQNIHGDRYITLDYLTTHPDHQRRGVASLLLESGLRFADQEGLKVKTDSMPQGVKVYEKHGFEVVKIVRQERPEFGEAGPQVTTMMVREPRSSG